MVTWARGESVKLFSGLGPIWTGIIYSKQLPVFTSEKYWIILIFLQMQGMKNEKKMNIILSIMK